MPLAASRRKNSWMGLTTAPKVAATARTAAGRSDPSLQGWAGCGDGPRQWRAIESPPWSSDVNARPPGAYAPIRLAARPSEEPAASRRTLGADVWRREARPSTTFGLATVTCNRRSARFRRATESGARSGLERAGLQRLGPTQGAELDCPPWLADPLRASFRACIASRARSERAKGWRTTGIGVRAGTYSGVDWSHSGPPTAPRWPPSAEETALFKQVRRLREGA